MALSLRDDGLRYGVVTRVLHWTMAALFAWQFAGVIIEPVFGEGPVADFVGGTHRQIGTILMALLIVRGLWGLYNLGARPPHRRGPLGFAAVGGHLALYGLMLVVPALALLRQYGSGRALDVFGLTLMTGGRERVEWMIAPASAVHGLLGWVLLAMIVGHIGMVLIHRFVWKDGTLARMAR